MLASRGAPSRQPKVSLPEVSYSCRQRAPREWPWRCRLGAPRDRCPWERRPLGEAWKVLCRTGLVLASVARVAHADAEERLSWDAPAECPSRDHVVVKLEDTLGRRLDDLAVSPSASARVER